MIIRTAYWTGTLKPGVEDEFFDGVMLLKPRLEALPGVKSVYVKRPYEYEPASWKQFCELSVVFDSKQDLATMLASEGRAAVRAAFAELVPLFDGTIHHVNFETQ
jgi:hypothetical protein